MLLTSSESPTIKFYVRSFCSRNFGATMRSSWWTQLSALCNGNMVTDVGFSGTYLLAARICEL